jgi:hypothetical protein
MRGRPPKGFNKYQIRGDITVLFLEATDGKQFEAIIDTEDLQRLIDIDCYWSVRYNKKQDNYYIRTSGRKHTIGKGTFYLHQVILDEEAENVHHCLHDPFDNRKDILRAATKSQNLRDRKGANKNNKSGYRNVTWSKSYKEWIVQLYVDGKNMVWRGFNTPEEANGHATLMRSKYYGEFAGKS